VAVLPHESVTDQTLVTTAPLGQVPGVVVTVGETVKVVMLAQATVAVTEARAGREAPHAMLTFAVLAPDADKTGT
jgi:hypothetical protein